MKKTLLLIIDFINDIIHEEGKIPVAAQYVKEHHVIECVNEVIAWARKQSVPTRL